MSAKHELKSPYGEGYRAGYTGEASDNPYAFDVDSFDDWSEGYADGERDATRSVMLLQCVMEGLV
jgi:hypothetical protein